MRSLFETENGALSSILSNRKWPKTIEERWKNWLSWDPLTKVQEPEVQERLKSLKGLFIDCGDQDQYNLLFGARRLHRELSVAGINHHYEEFDDNHSGIDYRMDVSLPYLYECIAGPLR